MPEKKKIIIVKSAWGLFYDPDDRTFDVRDVTILERYRNRKKNKGDRVIFKLITGEILEGTEHEISFWGE